LLYCTGLGAVKNPPAAGAVSPSSPPSSTVATATLTVGGVPATVSFAGLAPGYVGLYQVNFQIPNNAPSGGVEAVTLSIGGVHSNSATIAIQ
jgi:uncharacterized protein (TIGR03437 family)